MSAFLSSTMKLRRTEASGGDSAGEGRVRLPSQTIDKIRAVIHGIFPGRSKVMVFGSRACPDSRGGDLDLLVIAEGARDVPARARILAIARLQMALGEQHIDLVVTSDPDQDNRLIVREALRTGILL